MRPHIRREVHGLAGQFAMNPVGHEGRERGEQPARRAEHLVKRGKRTPIVGRSHVVEPLARSPHVPLGNIIIHELHYRAGGAGGVVPLEQPVRLQFDRRQSGERPLVEQRPVLWGGIVRTGRPAKVRVLREHAVVQVLERDQESAGCLANDGFVKAPRLPDLARRHQKKPHRIRTVAIHDGDRVHRVATTLRHLLPLGVEHEVVDHDVSIGRCERRDRASGMTHRRQCALPRTHRVEVIAEAGGDCEQGIEPSARLVHPLGDEISGETSRELFGVLERIVPLREGHRAGVEPRVDHLRYAPHRAGARWCRPGVAVDERLVRIEVRWERTADVPGKFLIAANDLGFGRVFIVHPYRQWCAPVSIS